MAYDAPVLIPTLIGSLLSCVATTGVLISYIIYAEQQKSFRHALVLNLALAGETPTKIPQRKRADRLQSSLTL